MIRVLAKIMTFGNSPIELLMTYKHLLSSYIDESTHKHCRVNHIQCKGERLMVKVHKSYRTLGLCNWFRGVNWESHAMDNPKDQGQILVLEV